jgi:hypothetical protein
MADNTGMTIKPDEVAEVTKQLDALADRLQHTLSTEAPNLAPTASARDEVSQRVASTLTEVHESFGTSADKGVAEIHEIAATLRAHSNNIADADSDFVR